MAKANVIVLKRKTCNGPLIQIQADELPCSSNHHMTDDCKTGGRVSFINRIELIVLHLAGYGDYLVVKQTQSLIVFHYIFIFVIM